MNFALSEEQQAMFDMAYEFGQSAIAPHALDWDAKAIMPKPMLREAAKLGFAGICVSEEQGGSGLSRLDAVIIFEALAMSCPTIASFLSIHNIVAWMVSRFGSDGLRDRFQDRLNDMELIASYCLTEPGAGSDAAALTTSASKEDGGYRLNGAKAFVSGGDYSEIYLVMCRTGQAGPKGISAILVEKGAKGLSFGAQERKMGWRAQPTAQLNLDNCLVPKENLLGVEGEGFSYAMQGLDSGRLNIAAAALGGAQQALNATLSYSKERRAFGRSLDHLQSIQFKLADMETRLQAARVFLHKSAWMLDQAHPLSTRYSAMAKRFVTDSAFHVANEALQIHGGYGYLTDYGIEKIVRDLRVHQILEGTNDIMQLIVGRSLLAERDA